MARTAVTRDETIPNTHGTELQTRGRIRHCQRRAICRSLWRAIRPAPAENQLRHKQREARGANTIIDVPANNTAATLAAQSSTVTTPDGTKITHTFDKWGNIASTTITETDGVTSTEIHSNTPDGLVTFIQRPEGNTETLVYDTNDLIFRAHGNLMSITVNPGPRGGSQYTETFHYDYNYNIQSGDQVTANGFTDKYQLTSDNRDIGSIDYNGAGTKTMVYNDNGQMTQVTDEKGETAATAYDSSTGFVTSHTAGSIQFTYSYDGSIASQLGKPASIAPPWVLRRCCIITIIWKRLRWIAAH